MKKIYLLFLALIIIVGLSSCAYHSGYLSNSTALNSNNFTYVQKNISGSAKATYIFGIGGLSKQALVDLAKQHLMGICSLKDNQALANTTVNWKRSYFFIGSVVNCTVTADIVEFK